MWKPPFLWFLVFSPKINTDNKFISHNFSKVYSIISVCLCEYFSLCLRLHTMFIFLLFPWFDNKLQKHLQFQMSYHLFLSDTYLKWYSVLKLFITGIYFSIFYYQHCYLVCSFSHNLAPSIFNEKMTSSRVAGSDSPVFSSWKEAYRLPCG